MKKCRKCNTELNKENWYRADKRQYNYICHNCKQKVSFSYFRDWRKKDRLKMFEIYGNKCELCGEQRKEFLAIDHVFGGGNKHRLLINSTIASWLRRQGYPKDGYRILCHNCNRLYAVQQLYSNKSKRALNNQKVKEQVINAYGGKCTCCGENRSELLTIDHIHNDGAQERKKLNIGKGKDFYYYLIKNNFPKDRYQLLCFNCNSAKGYYKQCPHVIEKENK